MKNFLRAILLGASFTFAIQLLANEYETQADKEPVQIEIVHENEWIEADKPFSLLIHFKIDENWHTYWKNPGASGMAANIDWKLPEGFKINDIHWQAPERFTLNDEVAFGYENEMILLVDMQAPSAPITTDIQANINWLACSDSNCLPGNSEISTNLTVKNEAPNPKNAEIFQKTRENLPKNHWDVEITSKTGNIIELKAKAPEGHEIAYTGGYFCPESTELIDHSKTLTHFKNEDSHYRIPLSITAAGSQTLKGVLVLFHEVENKLVKESLAINLPVNLVPAPDEELIGMLNPSEMKSQPADLELAPESEFEGGFAAALLFAFIGGMLLNLMPCVLPVLSLKIFSFVKMSGESRSLCLKHGLSFSLGVLISFWVLAGALLILQAYGKSVGWGFQLQEPVFVAILASIIFILGLNLFGVMELGTSITSVTGNLKTTKEGLSSSFFSGILATAIATPCTGPFLGSAVGYAVTLPSILALLIFTMLGIGMAFPYLLLSAYPSLLRFIPKPGNWMITFKEIMGFLMMATTVWLLWVFGAETSSISMIFLMIALLLFGVSAWIYGKWTSPIKKKLTRRMGYLFSLGFFALGVFIIHASMTPEFADQHQEIASEVASSTSSSWEPFSETRLAELQAKGIPVFVDFTAKWCLICQTNHMSLTTNQANDKFASAGVVRMKADWTKSDPVITKTLRKFGRNSVPLYVLYGKNPLEKPKVLPQVLTSDIVVDYLSEL